MGSTDYLNNVCNRLGYCISVDFSDYFDRDVKAAVIYEKIRQIFWSCVEFKCKTERGEFSYQFYRSPTGTPYSNEYMRSVNGETCDGSIVQITVWPAIIKVSADNDWLLLGHEAVWTSKGPRYPSSMDVRT